MVSFHLAYTAPINRPGQSPVLTRDQVWAAFEQKVHRPVGFVPVIEHCEVVSSATGADDNVPTVTRDVRFRAGSGLGPGGGAPAREVCKLYPPCRVDFFQADGSKVANYISQGPSGEPTDLFMTFAFELRHPGVAPGSEEAARLEAGHRMTAKKGVEGSIEATRRLVSEGKI